MKSNSAISEFRRLSGIGPQFTEWKRAATIQQEETASALSEDRESGVHAIATPEPLMTLERAKIRRMARIFEEDRMQGTHLPSFDWVSVRHLMEAAKALSPDSEHPAHVHWAARKATDDAHAASNSGSARNAHSKHSHAADMHAKAAKHLGAAGHHDLAKTHAAWSQHHQQHAAHAAKALSGTQAKAPSHAAPTDPVKKANTDPEDHPATMSAQAKSRHAMDLTKDNKIGHKQVAGAHKDASHEHLQAALHHFHGGHQKQALAHFNAAIHHMNKHGDHMAGSHALAARSQRMAAGGGARAAAGMGGVRR